MFLSRLRVSYSSLEFVAGDERPGFRALPRVHGADEQRGEREHGPGDDLLRVRVVRAFVTQRGDGKHETHPREPLPLERHPHEAAEQRPHAPQVGGDVFVRQFLEWRCDDGDVMVENRDTSRDAWGTVARASGMDEKENLSSKKLDVRDREGSVEAARTGRWNLTTASGSRASSGSFPLARTISRVGAHRVWRAREWSGHP